MIGTNINKYGKTEKNKNVKEGDCIFPFKFKWNLSKNTKINYFCSCIFR